MTNRVFTIDVCDYTNTIVCPIYTHTADVSGQAVDVHHITERNGWKEVHFLLPTKCHTDEGEEDNFRLGYIIPDYKLRVVTEKGPDWFLITEDSVEHEAGKKNIQITAGHVSQLLKNRALDIEFSDEEGNNVGTIKQLAKTILENTHWSVGKVATLLEDDGVTEKVRSLVAPVKTGALRLIEQLCEKFEARAEYNGDTHTVNFYPMNPFSELEPGEIPEAVYPDAEDDKRFLVGANVIELHYDKEVKRLNRKRNTENIATRLYAYGSYGDYVNRYCSIQTGEHIEYTFTVQTARNGEFKTTDKDGVERYFKANLAAGQKLIWSMLDYNSRSYVWNDTTKTAYRVYDTPTSQNPVSLSMSKKAVMNYFPFLSDYTYYDKVGLLTEEMFQKVAAYQRNMAKYYQNSIDAQTRFNDDYELLSDIGVPKSGFLKLDISSCQSSDSGSTLNIRWSSAHPDGVIYRSDYMEAEKNYFEWSVAHKLKSNGDPVSGPASIIYVLHPTDTVMKWQCAYLKKIDNRTRTETDGTVVNDGYNYALSEGSRPKTIQVWGNISVKSGDSVYLFCRNSLAGKLGARFSEDEAALETLEGKTTLDAEKHPTTFIDWTENLPPINVTSHGWVYRYKSTDHDTPGKLYFCWASRNDTSWHEVTFGDTVPSSGTNGSYFFHTKYRTLWRCESGTYIKLESVEEQTVAKEFSIVYIYCRKRDKIYKGLYENYTYTAPSALPANYNCAIPTNFGYYYLFTTDRQIQAGQKLRLNTEDNYVYQDDNVEHILQPQSYPYDTLIYPEENNLNEAMFFEGSIDSETGADINSTDSYRSNYISTWPNDTYSYSLPSGSVVLFYDATRNFLGSKQLSSSGTFSTASDTPYSSALNASYSQYKEARYMRIVFSKASIQYEDANAVKDQYYLHLKNYTDYCFANDKKFRILKPIVPAEDEPTGINTLVKQFKTLSDKVYLTDLGLLKAAQKKIIDENADQLNVLGDILREAWWQDASYVQGDENRLYNDALANLRKIAQPEIDYTFDYLSMYGSNKDKYYSANELNDVDWPLIDISDAAHLVDPELKINQWAYIDRIDDCVDMPWQTTIDINTQLTLIGQHEFKDVMTRIAEVASETKAKQTLYQRAEVISDSGTISTDALDGEINTEDVQIVGGSTGLKTDDKGNFILESTDGLAAIKFNGSGLFISAGKNEDGDWIWKRLGTGFGLDADCISQGNVDGRLITKNTIRADQLMANVGNDLDIGSNTALTLFATTDGVKPSGSLKTSDALIQIRAGASTGKPASINLLSGGSINLIALNEQQAAEQQEIAQNGTQREKELFDQKMQQVVDENTDTLNEFNTDLVSAKTDAQNEQYQAEMEQYYQDIQDGKDATRPEEPEEPTALTLSPSINFISGGSTNFVGGSLNMIQDGEINLASGSDFNVLTGGSVNILSSGEFNVMTGGSINMIAGGSFNVWSGNFVIDGETGDVFLRGRIEANEGRIANWYIGKNYLGNSAILSESSVGLKIRDPKDGTDDGIVFWAGNKSRANAPFKINENGTVNISGDSSFIINKVVNDVNYPNVVLDNSGLKIGRIGETAEELSAGNYNFSVTSNGYAVLRGIRILDSTFEGSSLGDNSKISNTSINDSKITNGVVSSSAIVNSSFQGGEIHIGPADGNGGINDVFTANETAGVTIQKGSIRLGPTTVNDTTAYNFDVGNDGEAILRNAEISGGSIGGFTIAINGLNSSDIRFNSSSSILRLYSIWNGGHTNPAAANFYVKKDGKIFGTSLEINGGENSGSISVNGAITGTSLQTNSVSTGGITATGVTVTNGNVTVTNGGVTVNSGNVSVNGGNVVLNGGLTVVREGTNVAAIDEYGNAGMQNLTVYGVYSNPSSREVKENIQPLKHRDAFDQLEPVSFQYKNSPQQRFGLVYEQVQDLYPEVCIDQNGDKSINYMDMISVLIKEVQDLRKRVAELERK